MPGPLTTRNLVLLSPFSKEKIEREGKKRGGLYPFDPTLSLVKAVSVYKIDLSCRRGELVVGRRRKKRDKNVLSKVTTWPNDIDRFQIRGKPTNAASAAKLGELQRVADWDAESFEFGQYG